MLSLGPQDLRCGTWHRAGHVSRLCFDIMHLLASSDVLQVSCNVPSLAEPMQANTPPPRDAETICSAQKCYLRIRHLNLNSMAPGAGLAMLVTTALITPLVMHPLGAR